MADKIAGIIYAIFFTTPLFYSIYYLIKVLKSTFTDWRENKNTVFSIAIFAVTIVIMSTTSFLIFTIGAVFVFPSVEMPRFFEVLGLVLSLTYICLFSGVAFGLGTLGHAGISPSSVIQKLYELFPKKK